jgi:hypothetical protein
MFVRVRGFCETHLHLFLPTSMFAQLFAQLNQVIAEVTAHATAQAAGKNASAQGTSRRAAAREALLEDLETISQTARAMAFRRPEISEKFRLPRGKINDQILLSTARSFGANASPVKDDFISFELPSNFLEDLQADINNFEQAVAEQNQAKETSVAANAALDPVIERGLDIVRQLDAIVRNKFRDDPAILAAWASASHVERSPRRNSRTQTPPTETQTPPTAPAS